jgi:adenylate cyclase
MAAATDRPAGRGLFGFLQRLREAQGKAIANVLVTSAVAVVAAAAAIGLSLTTPFHFLENFTYDLRQMLGAPPAPKNFIVVKIDDQSLEQMRQASPCHCSVPMDKSWLADKIVALDQKGAKAVVVDYLLDTWTSQAEADAFQAKIAAVKAPVIVGVDPDLKPGVDYPIIKGVHYADARALVNADYDDIMRGYDPKPSRLYSLSGEAARQLGAKVPLKPFDIRYRQPYPGLEAENSGAIGPSFPAAFIEFTPAPLIKDKIAFIGRVTRSATATGVLEDDTHTTPLRFLRGHTAGTPGIEIHAHALAQILAGDRIRKPSPFWNGVIVLAAAFAGALLGRSTQRWWLSIVIIVIGIALAALAAYGLYAQFAFMAPITPPAVAFTFGFFILSRLAAAELNNQRAFYSSTLERYLAPQVIDRMVDGGEAVQIGAEEREISVMISDLENFSSLVATLDLKTFSEVINEYFDGVIDILWKHEAMIDKMTGDGIIAIFGAPVLSADHADRAIACAREIDGYALAIRERMIARGIRFGHTRMGISSGVGLVGNFGGQRRFNYTAYGEVVVIAARLEAANKAFNTRILFSGHTLKLARNREIPIEPVGEIDLKGVPVPIPAYTTATT